jgi:bifunctional non-homologous end joining protein LigD
MAKLPRLIRPMLASLRHEFPPDEEAYGWELKWDGLRAVAYV